MFYHLLLSTNCSISIASFPNELPDRIIFCQPRNSYLRTVVHIKKQLGILQKYSNRRETDAQLVSDFTFLCIYLSFHCHDMSQRKLLELKIPF